MRFSRTISYNYVASEICRLKPGVGAVCAVLGPSTLKWTEKGDRILFYRSKGIFVNAGEQLEAPVAPEKILERLYIHERSTQSSKTTMNSSLVS